MKAIDLSELIVAEGENYVVINKPSGISSLEDRNSRINILSLARSIWPDSQLCHRLDKETTGCLIISKDSDAYKFLTRQFQDRKVDKTYLAIVHGNEALEQRVVDIPIHTTSGGQARIDKRHGKEALTKFQTLEIFRRHSLVECKPHSGKLHQIRVHLKWIKMPIVGDSKYGGQPLLLSQIKPGYRPNASREERPLMNRFALHAKALKIDLPDGSSGVFEADLPKDFNGLLTKLRKYS